MSAETALYSALSGDSAVAALVAARIYPDLAPQDIALPCVAFSRVDTEYVVTIHSAVPAGQFATLEIACMATTRTGADALADAVITAAAGAGFTPEGRRAELDAENNLWAAVLTVQHFS